MPLSPTIANDLLCVFVAYSSSLLCITPLFEYTTSFFKNSFLLYFFKIYLFIYFWLHWVFVAVHGLSLVAVSGGYSSLRCAGFSLPCLLLLWRAGCSAQASVVVARRLSSCGAQA